MKPYVGRWIVAVVPGTSAGEIRFPPGEIVGVRDRTTVFVVRKGRKIPEESEALIFTVRFGMEFRSPLTEAPIRGLLVNLRVPELVDDELSGNLGPKGSKALITAVMDPAILGSPESEPDLDEKNSDHYGPGYLLPA